LNEGSSLPLIPHITLSEHDLPNRGKGDIPYFKFALLMMEAKDNNICKLKKEYLL